MKKKYIPQNLGKQSGSVQPPVKKARQIPALRSNKQVISSPTQSRVIKVWNSNNSSDHITNPSFHTAAHSASLLGQQLPSISEGGTQHVWQVAYPRKHGKNEQSLRQILS